MFRISIKIIGTVLVAVAVAVPVSSAGGPRTPAEGNSLGVLPEYQQPDPEQAYAAAWPSYRGLPGGPKLPSDRQVFSLSTALAEYQRKSPRVGEGFSFNAPSYWNAAPSYWSTVERMGARTAPDPEQAYAAAWPSYRGLPGGPPALPVAATDSRDFDWGDAGIGAAGMLGIMLLAGGFLAALIAVRNRREAQHA
jgi:hypothetical protein